MRKKSKTVFTAVVAALFVLSVSYFALLAPTTAWYYQDDSKNANYTYEFQFGDFNMTEGEHTQVVNTTIPLRAATRFADAGEVLFDEVAHVVKVDVSNTGSVKGQVNVTVDKGTGQSNALPSWLKWFVYDTTQAAMIDDPTDATSMAQTKGGYKQAIESMLGTVSNYNSFASDAAYETYNAGKIAALEAHNELPIVVETNTQKVVYVVFWAEYGPAAATTTDSVRFDAATDAVTLSDCSVQIDFTATPYTAETKNISVTNNTSSACDVQLYADGSLFTESPADSSTGRITVAANATVQIPQTVGTRIRLTLPDSTGAVYFANGTNGIGTQSGTVDQEITDTVSSRGNTYTIETTKSISVTNNTSSAQDIVLYVNNTLYTQSPADSTTGRIALTATGTGATVQIPLALGAQIRLVLPDSTGAVHFANGTNDVGTLSGTYDQILSDSVSAVRGHAYTIETTTISVTNKASSAYIVKLYLGDTLFTQSPANASGEISGAADATVQIPQPVGTQFRLEIPGSAGAVHFVNGSDSSGVVSGDYDEIVSDTVSARRSNAYRIVVTPAQP